MRKWGLILLILAFVSFVQAAPPEFLQTTEAGTGNLVIVYPQEAVYQQAIAATFSFDILNSTLHKLTNVTTNCSYTIVDRQGDGLASGNLIYDGALGYWYYKLSTTQTATQNDYFYYVYCSHPQEKGFLSTSFKITADGFTYANNTTFVAVTILIALVILIYTVLAINWNFNLLEKGENKTNAVKVLLVWLTIWAMPLLVQLAIELADSGSLSTDIVTLLGTAYQLTIWIGYSISVLFVIMFVYELLVRLGKIKYKKQ